MCGGALRRNSIGRVGRKKLNMMGSHIIIQSDLDNVGGNAVITLLHPRSCDWKVETEKEMV